MSAVVTKDVELENILQHIFMECDVSMSTSDLTLSIGDGLQISKIISYIQEQLPTWSIDNLAELWKCLETVSMNDHVNLQQFKEATKCWIANLRQIQPLQDSNNNTEEKIYIVNDADTSMKTMDTNKDIVDFELRVKFRELQEENIFLHDELERHEASVNNARQQHSIIEKQLDRYVQKCQQLEKENDEQREQLNEAIKNEKTMTLTLQKSTKEYQTLMKQLEAIEIEVQAIPSLKEKVEKISKEKTNCLRQIVKLQEKFDEKENECNELKVTMTELESTNISMRETYEYKIRNLRERNRQLTEENTELQSISVLNGYNSGERLSMSPIFDMDRRCTHSTPYKSEKVPLQNSLYAELKASGFAAECSRYESCKLDLEEELDEYDAVISTISEQIEKVVQTLIAMRGSTYDVLQFNPQDMSARAYNIEALKHKVAFLLNMTTEEITKKNTKESSTQLRADSMNTTEDLGQYGVTSFQDLFLTRAQLYPKPGTNLWPITPQCVNEDKDDNDSPHDDVFLKVIRTYPSIKSQAHIISPIVEELHDIIESTLNTLAKDHSSSSASSRYRSIHTLSSSPQSQQSSPLNRKDSERQTSDCQSSRANSPDVSFAQGDGLTQGSSDKKSALTLEPRISSEKDFVHPEGNQSSEMSQVSDLQVNSKIASEEETSAKSIQTPEASGVNNPTSPRRKISVYCRSFDLMQDPRDDQESVLKMRQSSCDQPAKINERHDDNVESGAFKYSFNQNYRNIKNDSDSSTNSTPQKQSRDSLLEDEPSIGQSVRKVCLAPTRLKFPQKVKSELNEVAEVSDCAPSAAGFPELAISSSPLSSIVDRGRGRDDAAVHSSSIIIDEREVEVMFKPKFPNGNISQKYPTSARRLILHNHPSANIADSENPHSQANARRVNGKKRVERSVDSQMSSREESSAGSDSECEPAAGSSDQCIGEKVANNADRAVSAVSRTSASDSASTKVVPCRNAQNDGKSCGRDLLNVKQGRRQRLLMTRRAISEGESSDRSECRCKQNGKLQSAPSDQTRVFPSLTDSRLHESGIANLSETDLDVKENLSELELQKRYIAFSLCLCTDRVTLPQRVSMSLRQRNQTEKNLVCEVQRMQQAIQELAPLCTDRESVERVERVRHQLDMIARCAHRVSCAAETLGAVHQERRVSRAVLLADRYLQILHSRCEKLAANVAETKRILVENNIVIEENSGELGDDLPRIRCRSGTSANNRIMDTARQRNSVSGRMTLRRPSVSSESPKWENEKLDRTDSNSIGELRGIFEQAESRRSSREENNNMRLNHSNSQNIINCPIVDDEIWTNAKQEASPVVLPVNKDTNPNYRLCTTLSQPLRLRSVPWRTMLWGFLFFFLGFFVNQGISMMNTCNGPLSRWPIEQIFSNYVQIRNAAPHPM
ncbi:uncharacterized protein [Linepithema humile]|uniref:uncharacterized protein isoform X4 n=1 Tax=Linepithema humile TaxID=83485 RepID=UPI00351DE323